MNSGMFQVPDSHPTPSDFRSGFGDSSLVLFGRSGLVSPSRRCSLGSLLCFALLHA